MLLHQKLSLILYFKMSKFENVTSHTFNSDNFMIEKFCFHRHFNFRGPYFSKDLEIV